MGGGGKSSTTTQSVSIPPEVMARYNAVNTRAEGLASTPFRQYSQDPNAFVAPLNTTQVQGIQQAGGFAQAAIPAYQQAMGQVGGITEAGRQQTQAAYQPLMQGYTEGRQLGQAAEGMYLNAPQAAYPFYTQAQNNITEGMQYGQGLNRQAVTQGLGAMAAAQPYYNEATSGTRAGLAGAQPFQQLATNAAMAGSQAISPEQFSGSAVNRYMSPFMGNVVNQTMAAQAQQNAQQRQALTGDAIRSGAFGGDRAGIAQANLAYQQNLANQQTIANLLQGGYGQALGAFQQQQGVNLAADQANRAAQQQLAQQALAIGQQGYGQQMGAAQQMANLGQQLYGQQMGTAGFLQGAGQQGFQQQLAAAQAQQGLGSQLAGMQFQQAQGMQGLGAQQAQLGAQNAAQQAALAQQGYGMGMGSAQAYANLGAGLQGAGLQGAQAALQAGTVAQQTEQAGKQALYNQFLQEQSYPFQVAQFLANIAMGTGALSGSTTTTTQPAPFFSDKRVKDDIEPIGETYDGQKIVKFNYKGSPQKQIGLIAQDVEKHHPEAVGLAGGIKTVDYDAATREAAERGRESEGGSVTPIRAGLDFARGGYALGGSSAFDQDFIKQLLANQAGQYAAMYGQPGTPRGAQGTPGMASRVPAATLPVGRLPTAGSAPQQQPSMMSQGMSAAKQGAEIASLLKQGKEGMKYVTGGVDEKGNKIPSLMDRARAFGQEEQGPQLPGGTTTTTTTPGPRADIPADAAAPGLGGGTVVGDVGLGSGKIDPEDMKALDADLFGSVLSSRGGLRMAAGGGTDDEDITAPEGMYAPVGAGLNIPDETSKNKMMEPGKPPAPPKSGAGEVMDAVKTAAKIAAMFMVKDGGRINKANGGPSEEDLKAGLVPLTGEVLAPVRDEEEKKKAEGLVRLAKATPATATDASTAPTGLGGGTTPNQVGPTATGVAAPPPSNFDKSVQRVFQFEGGVNPRDTNGTPSVYGINQKANPDIDVTKLTQADAKQIYKTRYWDAIGADNMDPKLAHVAFDTAVIAGVGKAKELIEASGGDPAKLLQLRQDFQNGLLAKNPEKYGPYAKAWNNRISTLMSDIDTGTTAGARAPGVAGPGRGPTDAYSNPYATLMNKILPGDTSKETRDIATSENFWVPAIAGIGTMLASRSPYLGSAIGEGLVGATGAYTGLQKQQADIAQTRAQTEQTFANIVKDSIDVKDGRVFIRAVGPNGYYWIPFNEWWKLDPKDRPKVDPRVESYVSGMAPLFTQMEAAAAQAKPAPKAAPVGTTTAPATSAATPAAPATKPVSPGAPPAPGAAPATTTAPAPAPSTPPTTPGGVRTAIYLSPDEAKQAQQSTFNKAGAMFGLYFTDQEDITSFDSMLACDVEAFKKFFHGMLQRGVNFAPSAFEAGFISSAHSDEDIAFTIQAARETFAEMK